MCLECNVWTMRWWYFGHWDMKCAVARWRIFWTKQCTIDWFVITNSINLCYCFLVFSMLNLGYLWQDNFLCMMEPKRLTAYNMTIHWYATFSISVTLECWTSELWLTLGSRRSFLITSSASLFMCLPHAVVIVVLVEFWFRCLHQQWRLLMKNCWTTEFCSVAAAWQWHASSCWLLYDAHFRSWHCLFRTLSMTEVRILMFGTLPLVDICHGVMLAVIYMC